MAEMAEEKRATQSVRNRPRIREAIVVEGRYDKNTLAQVVDAPIVTLEGFAVFHDREKLAFLRRLAEVRGLIVFTDSDGAGFVLRRYLKGALKGDRIRHAYIPDLPGKERRKRSASKEGKLGVEGMRPEILLDCLRRAGATFLNEEVPLPLLLKDKNDKPPLLRDKNDKPPLLRGGEGGVNPSDPMTKEGGVNPPVPITKTDLFAWGLSGGEGSAERRRALLKNLSLPEKLGSNALLEALNLLYDRESLIALLREERS